MCVWIPVVERVLKENGPIQKQVERTRESDTTSPKNTTLYFIILLETKDLILACMNILNLYYEEHDKNRRQ